MTLLPMLSAVSCTLITRGQILRQIINELMISVQNYLFCSDFLWCIILSVVIQTQFPTSQFGWPSEMIENLMRNNVSIYREACHYRPRWWTGARTHCIHGTCHHLGTVILRLLYLIQVSVDNFILGWPSIDVQVDLQFLVVHCRWVLT